MRHYCRHHIQMISMKPPDSNIIQIALRFQLADGIFLRPAAVVKTHDFFHSRLLVRNYHLELIAVLMGNEQVELDRFLRLLFDLSASSAVTISSLKKALSMRTSMIMPGQAARTIRMHSSINSSAPLES